MPPRKDQTKVVLGRFEIPIDRKAGILGEGSFSIVQKGTCKQTAKVVAVKTFKHEKGKESAEDFENNVKKFRRQIEVLKMLMEPLDEAKIKQDVLKHKLFTTIAPRKCFLELIEYSRDKNGEPGPSAEDGKMYVVTEIADYSLKDYFGARLEESKEMSPEAVRQISKSFVVAMGMLHAKGLVHLDMKPENIMRAGSTWKVIDVDGCTPINQKISINDSTISFSPCYCAPEWANFLIEDGDYLQVGNQLDVWSVGISLCELIMLDAVLKPRYVSIYRVANSHRKAGFLFLEWLASPSQSLQLDDKIRKYDPQFVDMVVKKMLTKKPDQRISLAQALDHDYLKNCVVPGLDDDKTSNGEMIGGELQDKLKASRNERIKESVTDKPPLMKGTLFKRNLDGLASDVNAWLRRDMWLAQNGNLCYFSQKRGERLVLLDVKHLARAKLEVCEAKPGWPKEHVMKVEIQKSDEDEDDDAEMPPMWFAAETAADLKNWSSMIGQVIAHPDKFSNLDTKLMVSAGLLEDFRNFKIQVRNRREKIDRATHQQYQPVFERELWKLNSDGDTMKEEDWTLRKMWLAKNGAFCYYSKKEGKELMYYRPDDIRYVKYRKLADKESCKKHSFELTLKAVDGVEYAPGVFAAESEEVMSIFLGCIEKYQRIKGKSAKK